MRSSRAGPGSIHGVNRRFILVLKPALQLLPATVLGLVAAAAARGVGPFSRCFVNPPKLRPVAMTTVRAWCATVCAHPRAHDAAEVVTAVGLFVCLVCGYALL